MKKRFHGLAGAAILSLASWGAMVPANAAPPTVVPSPGYDARLQEQRRAVSEPIVSGPKALARRHGKRLRAGVR